MNLLDRALPDTFGQEQNLADTCENCPQGLRGSLLYAFGWLGDAHGRSPSALSAVIPADGRISQAIVPQSDLRDIAVA
jgi:hypothetical protein